MPRALPDPALPLANSREENFAQLRAGGTPRIVAYGDAGYEPDKGNAKRLEQRLRVDNRIGWLKAQGAQRAVMTASDVRARQEEIAGFNVYPYLARNGDGSLRLRNGAPVIDWDAMGPEGFANVASIDCKTGKIGFYDKTPYLRDIGKQEGLGSGADAPVIPPEVLTIMGNLGGLSEVERAKKLATMAALSSPGDLGSENDVARMVALTLRMGGIVTLDGVGSAGVSPALSCDAEESAGGTPALPGRIDHG